MIYNGLKAIDRRKTAARVTAIANNQPLNPSRYNAIINVVNTEQRAYIWNTKSSNRRNAE